MNSLKKGEGVPLLNFVGGPGTLLLNFEGGPGVPILNFNGVPGPTFKLWGGPGSRVPGFRDPGSGFLVPLLHHTFKTFKTFTDCQIKSCRSLKRRAILQIPSTVF